MAHSAETGPDGAAGSARRPSPGPGAAPPTGGRAAGAVRLTWAQPEDLVGHELRQAAEDGRDPAPVLRAWLAAGGRAAPERAGASPAPAPPELRALAARLLDDLARLPSASAADEPGALEAIRAACPDWPPPAASSCTAARAGRTAQRLPALPDTPLRAAPGPGGGPAASQGPASHPPKEAAPRPDPAPAGAPEGSPTRPAPQYNPAHAPEPAPACAAERHPTRPAPENAPARPAGHPPKEAAPRPDPAPAGAPEGSP
ncbi:hypothetical protein ACFCWL_21795, partial [Streptomyces sp. NPDC056387]